MTSSRRHWQRSYRQTTYFIVCTFVYGRNHGWWKKPPSCCRRRSDLQILRQPVADFLIKAAAVVAFADPVVFVFPHQQLAGDAEALEDAPVFQRLIHRDAEVVLAYAEQNRRVEILGKADGILLLPLGLIFPIGAAFF